MWMVREEKKGFRLKCGYVSVYSVFIEWGVDRLLIELS